MKMNLAETKVVEGFYWFGGNLSYFKNGYKAFVVR